MNTPEPPNPLAFPFPLSHGRFSEGMSLRDYFAAAALTGELAAETADFGPVDADEFAEKAYQIADAMLARRVQP